MLFLVFGQDYEFRMLDFESSLNLRPTK